MIKRNTQPWTVLTVVGTLTPADAEALRRVSPALASLFASRTAAGRPMQATVSPTTLRDLRRIVNGRPHLSIVTDGTVGDRTGCVRACD
jgi:hypothetical protein